MSASYETCLPLRIWILYFKAFIKCSYDYFYARIFFNYYFRRYYLESAYLDKLLYFLVTYLYFFYRSYIFLSSSSDFCLSFNIYFFSAIFSADIFLLRSFCVENSYCRWSIFFVDWNWSWYWVLIRFLKWLIEILFCIEHG